MTEKDFQKAVTDTARILGWRIFHTRPAMTGKGWRTPVAYDGVGFPDLVMVRRERLIFAELKAGKNKLSEAQTLWLEHLAFTLNEVHIWHADGDFDEIVKILR